MKYIFISCILHCLVISLKTLKIILLLNLVTTIANKLLKVALYNIKSINQSIVFVCYGYQYCLLFLQFSNQIFEFFIRCCIFCYPFYCKELIYVNWCDCFSSIHVTASNTKNLLFQHQPTRALPYRPSSIAALMKG